MKKSALIFIVLFFTISAFAQTLRVDVMDSTATGDPGGSFVLKGYVHNIGNSSEVVQLTRKTNDIPDGWTTTLCFGNSCYPSFVDKPDPVGVEPGDSIFFDITFNTDDNPGYGEALLLFEAMVSGEKDSILFSVKTETPAPFSIDLPTTSDHGKPGQSFVLKGYIHNNMSDAVIIQMTRVQNNIPDDWATTLCFGSSCYPSFVDKPDPVGINPGDSAFFDITFNTGQVPDSGKTLLRFEDLVSGYKDSLWFDVSTIQEAALKLGHTISAASGEAGDSFELGGYVFNLTDSLVTVNLIRVLNQMPEGWSSSICFDVCVGPNTDSVQSAIAPMDSLAYTLTVYTAANANDSAKVRLKFFAVGAYDTLYQDFSVSTTATGIEDHKGLLGKEFRLFGNYPNPFNPSTAIRYNLNNQSRVKIDLFNVKGQFITTLLNQKQKAGYHEVLFKADHLPSGTYYYRLKTEEHTAFGKMLLIK